ncbi:MAG TPA: hypothetical protein VGH98_00490 [Gemmatimonadaceae bacterium]
MNATDDVESAFATFLATVDLPDPVPPAMPMMSGFTGDCPIESRLGPDDDIAQKLTWAAVGMKRPLCHDHV